MQWIKIHSSQKVAHLARYLRVNLAPSIAERVLKIVARSVGKTADVPHKRDRRDIAAATKALREERGELLHPRSPLCKTWLGCDDAFNSCPDERSGTVAPAPAAAAPAADAIAICAGVAASARTSIRRLAAAPRTHVDPNVDTDPALIPRP